MASTSWPSISTVCQPKARNRRAYASRLCPCRVGPRWPSRLTSTMRVRLSRRSYAACSAASPHRALGQLAVPAQHPDAVPGALESLAGQGDADADRQALAERAGGGLHPREPLRGGMPFETAVQHAEGEQFGVVDGSRGLVGGVEQGRGVALGQDEAVVAGVGGAVEVVVEVVGEQDGHQVGGGHGGGGVSGARGIGGPHTVHAQLLSEFDEFTGVHGAPSGGWSCWAFRVP